MSTVITDILAKRTDMPFHRFLGALKDSVTVYGSGGSTHLSGADLAGEMEHFMDCGHKTVKMKVGYPDSALYILIERKYRRMADNSWRCSCSMRL